MNVLIVYGTTEGQTRKIAQVVEKQINENGHGSRLIDATDPSLEEIKLHDFDAVIVTASLHVGRFQSGVTEFVRKRFQTLNGMRTMFLPVSLSAASDDPQDLEGLEKCLRQFETETGWRPGEVHNLKGAFRYTQYDFFKRWGMRLIARQKGVSTDTSHDQELTDWPALTQLVGHFLATVERARSGTKS